MRIALALIVGALAALLAIWLVADSVFFARAGDIYEDAVVVKICESGDFVWRLADGRLVVAGAGIVENIDTVCQSKVLP
jgi:hypothetical protein